MTWGGKEFIDSTDHGRQLQCAAAFDWDRGFNAESYNPTEAGSRDDGRRRQVVEQAVTPSRGGGGAENDNSDGILANAGREVGE